MLKRLVKRVLNRDRHRNLEQYVAYQDRIAREHLLPQLRGCGVRVDRPVLDVGCRLGGGTIAVARQLGVPTWGWDIVPEFIETAQKAAAKADVDVRFEVFDVINDPLPEERFGLVIMRDVVEHLVDLEAPMRRLRELVEPDGALYVVFPPWYGPYAGHQHNAPGKSRYMPYAHLIAPQAFLKQMIAEVPNPEGNEWVEDQKNVFQIRMTRRKFERIARRTGWKIHRQWGYLLRPAFMRMGLPTISNGPLGKMPVVGEFVSTACEYVLVPA